MNESIFTALSVALLAGFIAIPGDVGFLTVGNGRGSPVRRPTESEDPYGCTKKIKWDGVAWVWEPCKDGLCVPAVPSCDEKCVDQGGSVDTWCVCGENWPVFGACLAMHRVPDGGVEHIECWTVGCAVPYLCFTNHLASIPREFTPVCLCQ